MDKMVLETQKWLNETYGKDSRFKKIDENGKTGWPTIYALIRALQIELGISNTVDNFGPGTQSLFLKRWPSGIFEQNKSDKTTSNVYSIIQGSLWCKGYSVGSGISQNFYSGTGNAIKRLKADMGIEGNSTVTLDIMKSLLSMQQYVLLKHYGGTTDVRNIQQKINREYKNYTGIIPCDGLYGREMNKALIQILQSLEGYSSNDATGYFGNGTKSKLKTITSSNFSSYGKWVWLAKATLNCLGYKCIQDNIWNSDFENNLSKFQEDYKISVNKQLDINTWMALLTSKGNPDRPAKACDTRFEVTDLLLEKLKSDGYEIVGRYLTGGSFKEIKDGELERIVNGGMKYFPIFQENGRVIDEFTYEKGLEHGKKASIAALNKGVPSTVIYFAVDMDVYDYQIDSNIIPYFKGINETIDPRYSVGIYASRNVCTRIANIGYSISSFVSDMSTAFSGNLGFPIPKNWNYDQFHEIHGYGGNWDLDKVAYSGKISPCNIVLEKEEYQDDEIRLIKWIKDTEDLCVEKSKNILLLIYGYNHVIGRAILENLRKPEYWGDKYGGMWRLYTPEITPDAKEVSARMIYQLICDKQPKIKDKVSGIDIAHMSATILGYMHWGTPKTKSNYSLGDLGGWLLDLLQIWGVYDKEAKDKNLKDWLKQHLGSKTDGKGFGYDDVLADSDAYLIIKRGILNLSKSLINIYRYSKNERIKMFYKERFDSSKQNVIDSFVKVSDGIDFGSIENIDKKYLKDAAKADNLPTKEQAIILATSFADFIANPE